jgi:small subunit ribosomal protein S3
VKVWIYKGDVVQSRVEREAQEAELRQARRDRPQRRGPRSGSTGTTAGGTEAGRQAESPASASGAAPSDAASAGAHPQVDGDVVLPTADPALANAPVERSADVAETPAVSVDAVNSAESDGGPAASPQVASDTGAVQEAHAPETANTTDTPPTPDLEA